MLESGQGGKICLHALLSEELPEQVLEDTQLCKAVCMREESEEEVCNDNLHYKGLGGKHTHPSSSLKPCGTVTYVYFG